MGIVLAGGLAHLLELPAKMRLPRDEYAIVQQIYRGWAFLGIPVNRETRNWTKLPAHWEQLRRRWEYSHAINALIYVVALVLLMIAWVYTCRAR
jgi:hypothetical protein